MKATLVCIGIITTMLVDSQAQCCAKSRGHCLSRQERMHLRHTENSNITRLNLPRRGNMRKMPPVQGTLIWPLQSKEGLPENDFRTWYVSNQVDLDPNIDTTMADTAILDYNCGMRSYDNNPTMSNPSGYNHDGTDIVIYPHPYRKMNANAVEVIAAATGVIVSKVDTNVDRNCVWGTGRPSNNLTLLHDDGTKTRYVHLKQFSLTSKAVGDTIAQGEYIGVVGSSGNSTIPHLHFEVENSFGQIVDPFFGPCSDTSLTSASWWQNQLPYVDSAVHKIMTYTTSPGGPGCDMSDSTGTAASIDERILFGAGDTVWMGFYFSHLDENDTAHAYIYKPDNSLLWDFSIAMPGNFTKKWSPNYFTVLSEDPDYGLYEIEMVFMGQTYRHKFIVASCAGGYILAGNVSWWQYFQASGFIQSTAVLLNAPATDVTYKAGDLIELDIGFEVEPGAGFEAILAGCGDEGN